MISVDLSTRDCGGHVIVALRGELDMADAVSVAAALAAVAAREPEIIVDLAGLEFIDSSGVAALARGRKQARHAGGDLRLARSEEHTSELQSHVNLVCRLLLEKKKKTRFITENRNKKKKRNTK